MSTKFCGQCGYAYSHRACGPTHAIVAAQRRKRRRNRGVHPTPPLKKKFNPKAKKKMKPSRSEAALRKLLADVQEARAFWSGSNGVDCAPDPWPVFLTLTPDARNYLERLAREGLGEP